MARPHSLNRNASDYRSSRLDGMARQPGTYLLILRADSSQRVQVGRWGALDVHPGYYLYVGSAFGPGGVRARVSRHVRKKTARHWHIDYLRAVSVPVAVWCGYGARDLEHRWARTFRGLPGSSPVPGFGCTDCTCESHLFRFRKLPHPDCLSRAAGGLIELSSFHNDDC